jgi:aspartate kinase
LTHGFISSTSNGEPSLLGFEGSDLTATLIGMAMDAEKVEIWTDVDGIQTSDPARIKNTKSISQMSFEVAEELSFFGAKVLHPLTISPARIKNIPVLVLNSHRPGNPGTLITGIRDIKEKGVKSISCKRDILTLTITPLNNNVLNGFLNSVFRVLNRYGLEPDIVSISRENIGMTIESKEIIQKAIEEIKTFAQLLVENDKSQISIVGEGLKNKRGLMKKIFECMENYSVSMITGGSSENNISFVVQRERLDEIMQLLHDKLF